MSAWLRDHPTQTSFPGSLIDTQTSTFRFRRMRTQQRSAALSEHRSIAGVSCDSHEPLRSHATDCHLRGLSAVPNHSLFQTSTPDHLSVSRNEGGLSQRRSSIPFGNHAWTLSSRTTTAMRSRLCPTLSEELSGQRTHAFPLTYSLDTGGRPDGHGSNEHCQ
jgi:hypothetical protein